jgi:hypothetical protein
MKRAIGFGIVFVVALLLGSAVHAAGKGTLDGKTFQGAMVEEGTDKLVHDTISFDKGMFHSAACDAYGFGKASYTIKPDGSFEATTLSDNEGTMQWRGMVSGNLISGDALWLKPGKAPVRYTIHGTLR